MAIGRVLGATAVIGAAGLGYSYVEATRRFVVREFEVPVLPEPLQSASLLLHLKFF